jgi:2-polyprenyl-6-methoxyphenol hydroxylase-like FAD-dependent oxidoreductase
MQAALFWSLRHSEFAAWKAAGLARWKADVVKLWPQTEQLLGQITDADQMIMASYAHGELRSPVGRRLAHVGDSWHCASPQLGQGANMALLDAMALGRVLEVHGDVARALEAYAAARRVHVRLYQLASWMFTPAYQSDGRVVAWVRDWLMSPLSRVWPMPGVLAALVAGQVGAPLSGISAIGDG